MTAKRGYYSLLQFSPNPSRAEAVNLGVLLFCPEARFIAARTAASNQRAAKLVGRSGLDSASLNAAKRAIERRLQIDRERFQSLEDFQQFVDTRANVLKLTNPRPVKVFDPEEGIRQLFDELVGGRPRSRRARSIAPELDAVFHRLEQEGRARLDWKVDIPVVGRGLTIPYAYRNGVWNLVRPKTFPSHRTAAINQAVQLAVDGDLLRRRGADAEGEKRLVVVAVFEPGEREEDLESRVVDVFRAYEVRTVQQQEVPQFMAQVEQEAHL